MTKNPVILLAFADYKNTEYKLITPEAFKWMCRSYAPPKNEYSYREEVPAKVLKSLLDSGLCTQSELNDASVNVTIGTTVNDRALGIPGKQFFVLKELMAYLEKHELTIKEEYNGVVY